MGILKITTVGSFGQSEKTFSAMKHGHAHAVAEAIRHLSEFTLPSAIANDHRCHSDGIKPEQGFAKA